MIAGCACIYIYIFYTRVQILINRLDYPWVSSVRTQEFCKRCPGLPVLIVCMVSVDVKQHWQGERKKAPRDRVIVIRLITWCVAQCALSACVFEGMTAMVGWVWLWLWLWLKKERKKGQTVSHCHIVQHLLVVQFVRSCITVLNGFTLSFSCSNVAIVVIYNYALKEFTLSFSCSDAAVVFILCAEWVDITVIFMFKCCCSFHHSFLPGTAPFCLKICLVFFMGSLHHDIFAPPLTLSQECVIRVWFKNSQHSWAFRP